MYKKAQNFINFEIFEKREKLTPLKAKKNGSFPTSMTVCQTFLANNFLGSKFSRIFQWI
jgi:hypothetical protein